MFETLLIIFVSLISIPVVVLFVEVVLACFYPSRIESRQLQRNLSVAVLIPAHNEEAVISETINAVKSQLTDRDRILVIADNCSDKTAQVAAELGAEVKARESVDKLGKGYALDCGIEHLKSTGGLPEVVIVIDADCLVEEYCLTKLVDKCERYDRPVQALYLMHAHNSSPGQKIATFAWIVKNRVRPSGLIKLGLPCQLMGTGMAFPRKVFDLVSLANANIVEDLMLGIDLAKNGYSPVFCPEACVVSTFPNEDNSVRTQRTRWEHGHLGIIFSGGLPLLFTAMKKVSPALMVMAFDLMVPPLALLAVTVLTGLSASIAAVLFGSIGSTALMIMATTCLLFALSVLFSWFGYARDVLSFRDLLKIPSYIFSKFPIYAQFLTRRQKSWVRTNRD